MTTQPTRKQIEIEAKAKLPGFRIADNKLNGQKAYRIDGTHALLTIDDVMRRLGYC